MKNTKLKKNSFIEGTVIASIAIIFIKVIGALYVIPFYKIVGEDGGTLYSYAYSIYNLFLNISTAGIPIAISMLISEYLALNMIDAKERSYKISKYIIFSLSLICFLVLFIGSDSIARFLLSNKTDGHSIADVSLAIKSISYCLLVIPFLSALRGYMQGHKFISPTSIAQVIEQVVRVLIVIFGAYISIKLFKSSIPMGVSVALLGTYFGGLCSYIYLRKKIKNNKEAFPVTDKKDKVKNSEIVKKIFMYSIPLVIIAITDNLYTIIDIKLIIKGLTMVGYDTISSETVSSILATWAPKICTIIASISIALTTNIIPHITSSFAINDQKEVNKKILQAISIVLIISIPAAVLMVMLSNEAYYIFYGSSRFGSLALKLTAILNVLFCINAVLTSSLEAMKKFKYIYIFTFIGLVVNASLDIPMILLLDKLGLPSYVGTTVASCIGYIVSISLSIHYLKKNINFDYKKIFSTFRDILPAIICMIIPIAISKMYIKYDYNYLTSVLSLIIHGLIGGVIYLIITYRSGSINNIFGKEFVDKILKKLHLMKG